MSGTIGYSEALELVRSTDPRWREDGEHEDTAAFGRPSLEAFAHALAFLAESAPVWAETVTAEGISDWPHLEVRVLTGRVLLVMTAPWAPGCRSSGADRAHPSLRTVRGLEIDGFGFDADGTPAGCTIALLFPESSVRLGVAPASDRPGLARILRSLRDQLDA